ncbi:MAG: hypothetical protein ABJC33_03560 [Betaproteobacteria bacterium]
MPGADPQSYGAAAEPLCSLLYRYWFWGWLFCDVNQGDVIRRAASWRHNVAVRDCLTVYMRRWLTLTVVTALTAQAIESMAATAVVPAIFYTSAIVAIVIFAVAAVAWMFLAQPS